MLHITKNSPLISQPLTSTIIQHRQSLKAQKIASSQKDQHFFQKMIILLKTTLIHYEQKVGLWVKLNRIVYELQKFAHIDKKRGDLDILEEKQLIERLSLICQNIFNLHINQPYQKCIKSILHTHSKYKQSININKQQFLIHYKAITTVSQQMFKQFIINSFQTLKITYINTQKSISIFLLNIGTVQENFINKFDGLWRFVREVTKKGLRMEIDRKFLKANYESIMCEVVRFVEELKNRSEGAVLEMKSRSRKLYDEVRARIKAQEIEIKTEIRNRECQQLSYKNL